MAEGHALLSHSAAASLPSLFQRAQVPAIPVAVPISDCLRSSTILIQNNYNGTVKYCDRALLTDLKSIMVYKIPNGTLPPTVHN